MREHKISPQVVLTLLFATVVFIILFITMCIVGFAVLILFQAGILEKVGPPNMVFLIIVLAFASILIGTAVGAIMSRFPLKPVNILINGMNRLANGDFEARINMGTLYIAQKVSSSFNMLAEELQDTEMLRSDFVNNFSHEFKTPIVSIRGFAKLLLKGNLSEAKEQEYLTIIVEESTRLADMATNVLNLAKVENQNILTDITRFNLSEQIRNCVLLLEKNWSKKSLNMVVHFDDYYIHANEELLKQVWINLLDNAVKFSPNGGVIAIMITEKPDAIVVSVKNNGPEISYEDKKRIFDKFWQGDASHSSEGTGIGLSLVRRIAELHKGSISVISSPEETAFSIKLPKT
ncbi:HAMP domain-containing sensor histidine kinase [Paenibacillus sp. YN15]|uniref:sensor histidine kinase n=1 Tax=Paenibacillus sp. YN15 TaxID=1742774 RepID=UPI000DCF19A1|nr:HAMP domain-containing sensor histidine kinase [Paenibacillus sp. YN15]RAV05021.1 sensor histidine kinase [Paenibacillus sp. YN15]